MAEIQIEDLLKDDGPVAIIIKQPLSPVDGDDRIIFPPTYPVTQWNGRVHTIRDGDFRVTVELPTGSKTDKDEKKENQKPGYQIDRFPDGQNICEIDSPQSQSNRIEPKFKTIDGGMLVPQVEIEVGTEKVNLLDVGHRAGDAVVRMSSLAAEIHEAFIAAKSRDLFKLAVIAPTSLVFGVWDSRSTYVKQQRVFKAHIRATNVREISRSAQYTPATAYVDAGAVGEGVEKKTGDESNFSQEGMLHALSTQTIGGVILTDSSRLVRTVNVNLEAIRVLRGMVPARKHDPATGDVSAETKEPADGTEALQRYILGLALVAAFHEPDLNLREGCHLRYADGQSIKLVYRSKPEADCPFTPDSVLTFAQKAKLKFFQLAGITAGSIDHLNEKFETGVAEKFLEYSKSDRDKIRKLGPITAETLSKFETAKKKREQAGDPLERIRAMVEKVKTKNKGKALNAEADKLRTHLEGVSSEDDLKSLADAMLRILAGEVDPQEKINQLKAALESAGVPSTDEANTDSNENAEAHE